MAPLTAEAAPIAISCKNRAFPVLPSKRDEQTKATGLLGRI